MRMSLSFAALRGARLVRPLSGGREREGGRVQGAGGPTLFAVVRGSRGQGNIIPPRCALVLRVCVCVHGSGGIVLQ